MTGEEAKKWLRKLYARADITDEYGDMEDMQPYEEAINMAISALSENKEDLISRQAVLTLFNERFLELQIVKQLPENKVQEYVQGGVNWCINTVRDIPSVENKGEWIYHKGDVPYKWECNKCGGFFKTDFHFCPNCGADMRGE